MNPETRAELEHAVPLARWGRNDWRPWRPYGPPRFTYRELSRMFGITYNQARYIGRKHMKQMERETMQEFADEPWF